MLNFGYLVHKFSFQVKEAQGCARFAEILMSARYCGVCAW